MRGVKDFKIEKDPQLLRIALLGDSYTWGTENILNFNYASFLERFIPNSEVLNFGIFGIGIDLMYLRWKYEALKFKPDVLIMAIYTHDISRVRHCINKPNFEIENGKLLIKNIPPPSREEIAEQYHPPKWESYFLKHLIYNLRYLKGSVHTNYNHGFEILSYILDEMEKKSEEKNTFFMVAIINANGKPTDEELKQCTRLKELLEKMNIPYIESYEIFKNEGYSPYDPNLYTIESSQHFSALGNALFAQAIKNKLEESNIIKKQKNYYFEHDYSRAIILDITDTIINTEVVIMKNKQDLNEKIPILPFEIFDTINMTFNNEC